jgi:FKBP-type peptidyl-prolyl cis-trans isomerase FklB
MKELARREELRGAPLLEAALHESGAVKTESGMVLQVLERGAGPSPTIFDYVTINYSGKLPDGTVFDSNTDREPQRVQLGTTTRCWQEALGAVAAERAFTPSVHRVSRTVGVAGRHGPGWRGAHL